MSSPEYKECNFDGIVGPTHNYGGLSFGNVASTTHASNQSSPKQGALQGLKKAKQLADLGLHQGIIPPQIRPDFKALHELGFKGKESDVLEKVYKSNPVLLSICCSSSYMWTANAATVAPSCDTADKKLHFTVANLSSNAHRAIEGQKTFRTLSAIFNNSDLFSVKGPLSGGDVFADEGAANHTRLIGSNNRPLHLFVYGRSALNSNSVKPIKYPARQTLEASEAVARHNQLKDDQVLFVQQNPEVIDAGVFHNDVISVGNENVFLYHKQAFVDTPSVIEQIKNRVGENFVGIAVDEDQVGVTTAVQTYLFNSQIVSLPNGEMALIAPKHCEDNSSVQTFIDSMLADQGNPINKVLYFDLLQSMKNGGGPACLRLRVPMNKLEIKSINSNVLLSDDLYTDLCAWVDKHYRDQLELKDLTDIQFINEVREAFSELEVILKLKGVLL